MRSWLVGLVAAARLGAPTGTRWVADDDIDASSSASTFQQILGDGLGLPWPLGDTREQASGGESAKLAPRKERRAWDKSLTALQEERSVSASRRERSFAHQPYTQDELDQEDLIRFDDLPTPD